MPLGQVLADGAFAFEQIRNRVQAQAVDALVEPEAQEADHLVLDGSVIEVQVGLMREEAMPEVLAGERVPGPVGRLGVREDDPRVAVSLIGVAPDVEVTEWRARIPPRRLEPGVLVRRVVHDQLGDHAQATAMGGFDERLEVVEAAVGRLNVLVIRDVVAVVPQRRRVGRQQPQGSHAEVLDVVELLDQSSKVTQAIAVAVVEGLDVNLIQDGVLVPERIVWTRNATARPRDRFGLNHVEMVTTSDRT